MQAKLRQVGNSLGITIPANELKALSAHPGDIIEVQITQVIRQVRGDWDNPSLWKGADTEANLLEDIQNDFDDEEWQW